MMTLFISSQLKDDDDDDKERERERDKREDIIWVAELLFSPFSS